jgi:hypothetical protein
MFGEVNGDDATHAPAAGHTLEASLAWLSFYHVVVRPLGLIESDLNPDSAYAEARLVPRFTYFKTWRQYAHIHSLFWVRLPCYVIVYRLCHWDSLNAYTDDCLTNRWWWS